MLAVLRVRKLAIVDALELELGRGLNVVTGETGAGKSILVTALGLVLGGRARPELVRTGADRAEVEALFDLRALDGVRERLAGMGVENADELVIRRTVAADGRSRAYVNDRLTTLVALKELASGLVDISSQHEHHTLVDPSTHGGFLDAFAGLAPLRGEVGEAVGVARAAADALGELEGRVRARVEREALLRFQLSELDAADPKEGEEELLHEEHARLAHAERLGTAAQAAEEALYARDRAVCAVLGRVAADLVDAARVDPTLAPLAERVDASRTELEDVARELGRYARRVAADPARLACVEERLAALRRLARRFGDPVARRREAAAELSALEGLDLVVEDARAAAKRASDAARALAKRLSAGRREAAARLGLAITAELASLGMGDAEVRVDVAPGEVVGPGGLDRIEFLIAPNPGEEPRPLARIASGGELSRALLAIKRVLAGVGPVGLYVFDEVDTGVGGAVADAIGGRIREVATHHQVLCVTHLPQIAAYADQHVRVKKAVDAGRTFSAVERLDGADRVEEMARMLGGARVTDATRLAAAEMARLARG